MTDKELEQALRRALKPREPDADFSSRVMSRLDAQRRDQQPLNEPAAASFPGVRRAGQRRQFRRWSVPAALAACALVAVGLVQWRHESAERQRGVEARAQLLQALSIAGTQVNTARAAVLREEQLLD
ncbi:MAG TPA: hypothetical protein VMF64_14060 [Steroidobacteraceae bacterium]|nr:hypothetical protein [Steroidobacteraceae bacterium]